jgi:hypothetical protein
MTNEDLLFAKLCAIAYAPDAIKQYNRLNYHAAALHQKWSPDEAYVLTNGTQMCVVACGSTNWADWALRNFRAIPAKIPDLDIKAHWGLWEAAASVLPAIVACITVYRPEQLYFVGHSKGGAMALLWACALQQYNPKVISFGMPRVLATATPPQITHRRIVHHLDPVPRVPPRAMGWHHQGLPIVVGSDAPMVGDSAWSAVTDGPFNIRLLSDRVGCHFKYGKDLEALWEAR